MRNIIHLILLCFCLNFNAWSQSALLEKKVTLQYSNITLGELLKVIRKKYEVPISYANNLVPEHKKVNINVRGIALRYALSYILKDTRVTYEIIGNQIVLKKDNSPLGQAQVPKKVIVKPTPGIDSLSVSAARDSMRTLLTADSLKKNPASEPDKLVEAQRESPIPAETASSDTNNIELILQGIMPDVQLINSPLIEFHNDTVSTKKLKKLYKIEKQRLRKIYTDKRDSAQRKNPVDLGKFKSQLQNAVNKTKTEFDRLRDSLGKMDFKLPSLPKFLQDTSQKEPAIDSSALEDKQAQITIVTPLGTNGAEAPKYKNHLSLNVIAGYNGGVKGIELGGAVNVVKEDVQGFQGSGTLNIVGGETHGAQGSGFMNLNRGVTKGFQGAGFANINGAHTSGAQGAGFCNIVNGSFYGAQGAGFCNVVNGNAKGIQGAGFCNVNNGAHRGIQGAGFCNVARDSVYGIQGAGFGNFAAGKVRGVQGAGFCNVAGNFQGFQGAGFGNFARDVKGLQLSGFINIARNVRGVQLGILNYADSMKGVPIGLLSIVRYGYRRIEVYGSETMYGNVAFKSGVKKFYNILYLGGQIKEHNYFRWGYGYGIGSSFDLSSRLDLSVDLISMHVNEDELFTRRLNLLNRLNANLGFRFGKRASAFAGPSFNVMVSDFSSPDPLSPPGTAPSFNPWKLYEDTDSYGTNLRMWLGFQAGLRF